MLQTALRDVYRWCSNCDSPDLQDSDDISTDSNSSAQHPAEQDEGTHDLTTTFQFLNVRHAQLSRRKVWFDIHCVTNSLSAVPLI